MKVKKRYGRKTTGITVSIFYEQHCLEKYNFDAPYQRDYNVWDDEQKSFLIDTILKNFPMPPMYLEQKIDTKSGVTKYDVIDGKQRLNTIVDFIENRIPLPKTFGDDEYGEEQLNGKTFEMMRELSEESEAVSDYISTFWSYVLNIEYIENPDSGVVDNIFDRLNRGGERLNSQELRKANYYDSTMYRDIEGLRKDPFLSQMLDKLNKNRLADVSFLTELYLLIYYNKVIDGTEPQIDKHFGELADVIEPDVSRGIIERILEIKEVVEKFDLDLDRLKVRGVSHLYAIWYFAYYMVKNGINIASETSEKLNAFFEDLRGERLNPNTEEYHKSMQSSSKSKGSRKRRVCALLNYFGYEVDENLI